MSVPKDPYSGVLAEEQPLLAESPIVQTPDVEAEHRQDEETKQSPSGSVGGVFLKISFLLLGDYLASVDDMLFVAIYERVASEFSSSDRAAWLILVESLMCLIFVPVYGFTADRYGSKKSVLVAYVLLVASCLISSFATSFEMLVLGRSVSGIALAGMFGMTTIVIAENAHPSDVGVLRSYVNVVAVLGRNTGPIIGGWLSDVIGWRKTVLCEIPIAVLCFVMVTWFFDADKKEKDQLDDSQPVVEPDKPSKPARIDFWGILFLSVMMTALTFAMSYVTDEETRKSPEMIVSVVMFFTMGIALFFWERSMGDAAFIPRSIFNRKLGILFIGYPIWMCGYFSLLILVPKYFVRIENTKSSETAFHLVPMSLATLVGGLAAGRLTKVFNRYKIFLCLGIALGITGFFLIAFLWQGHVDAGRSFLVSICGLGSGFTNASIFVALNVDSEKDKKGTTIGFFYLVQEIGILIGISGSASLVQYVFQNQLLKNAPDVVGRAEIISKIIQDAGYAFTLPQVWQDVAVSSFLKGFQVFTLVGGSLAILAECVLLMIRDQGLE